MIYQGKDRRALCLTCSSRCDADRWTCNRCHARLLRFATEAIIDEAHEAERAEETD